MQDEKGPAEHRERVLGAKVAVAHIDIELRSEPAHRHRGELTAGRVDKPCKPGLLLARRPRSLPKIVKGPGVTQRGHRQLRGHPGVHGVADDPAGVQDTRVGDWAEANNAELACTPTNSSWLNRIEAQFTALRYFTLDGADHGRHKEQGSMIRRYIIWRNRHRRHPPTSVLARANVA